MPDNTRESRSEKAAKPYPWRCPRCLEKAVSLVAMPYRAKGSHDGRAFEIEIPEVRIPKCSQCGELVFSNSVDEQITHALRSHLKLLEPEQIRDARQRLNLNLAELADRLGTDEQSLARWEEGLVLQSRAMDNLMRVFFALPE